MRPAIRQGVIFVALNLLSSAICDATPASGAIESYLKPFVATNKFLGSVLGLTRRCFYLAGVHRGSPP